jgi:hypothetical protein
VASNGAANTGNQGGTVRRSSGRVGILSGVLPARAVVGLLAICCVLALPAASSANNLFSLDPTPESVTGVVVTEANGTAYFAWEAAPGLPDGADTTMFCKIPRGGSCTAPIALPLPSPGNSDEENVTQAYPVLGTRPGVVYVVGPRYVPNDTLIWTSTNGGESFSTHVKSETYGGRTGIDDVLLNPGHTATEKEPLADYFDIASTNSGLAFGEVSNTLKTPASFGFASPGVFSAEGSLGFTTASHLPVEAYFNLEAQDNIHFYANKTSPADEAKNWEGPKFVAVGSSPRLASGPAGLFMLSTDFPAGEAEPGVLDLRKFNEKTDTFEAPVEVAANPTSGLTSDVFENPETGNLYAVWPVVDGAGDNVLDFAESTDGGQTFHGYREVAAINGAFVGPPRLAVASDGRGWLTYNDEGGVEVANLATNTSVATSLSGGGGSGASVTVPQGTPVLDTATIGGSAGASAAGSVSYEAFANPSCSGAATAAGSGAVTGGVAGASSALTLGAGKYYWRASYSGDVAHEPSTSPCGSEVLTVLAPTSTTTVQTGGGISGASLTVPVGTTVSDQAHITGVFAASAGGTATYALYKDSKCTVAAAPASSVTSVAGGAAGASSAVKPAAGTYYWKVTYSGDAANEGSTSACGSEILIVALKATTLGLPSGKQCLSRRKFVVHPRAPKGVKLVSVEVQINGKFVKKGKLSAHATTVSLIGLPKGAFKVALISVSSKGQVYEEVRTFHTCVPGKHKHKK